MYTKARDIQKRYLNPRYQKYEKPDIGHSQQRYGNKVLIGLQQLTEVQGAKYKESVQNITKMYIL